MERQAQVLFLEHDHLQYEDDVRILRGIPHLKCRRIRTATDLIKQLDQIKSSPPNVIVANVNFQGTDPAPVMKKIPDELVAGCSDIPNTLGLRCLNMLAQIPELQNLGYILNTILSKRDMENLPSGLFVPGYVFDTYRMDDNFDREFRLNVLSRLPFFCLSKS